MYEVIYCTLIYVLQITLIYMKNSQEAYVVRCGLSLFSGDNLIH